MWSSLSTNHKHRSLGAGKDVAGQPVPTSEEVTENQRSVTVLSEAGSGEVGRQPG